MSRVEIYTIAYDFNRWHYTSADEDFVQEPVVFRAVPMRRSGIEISTDDSTAEFSVEMPLDAEFLELFRVSPPTGAVTLLCEGFDSATPNNRSVVFKGRVINVAWSPISARVSCESSSQAIRRMGLRRHFQYGCPHMLYGGECRVDREQYVTVGSVSNVTGGTVDVLAAIGKADDWFPGGYLEYTHNTLGTTERIAISDFNGTTGRITLFSFPTGMTAGDIVRVYAGCNRTMDACAGKFNNVENFGGFPFIPTKNPFSGDPVY